MPWVSPTLQVKWGPFFPPDPTEQVQIVTLAQTALGAGGKGEQLVTKRIAVEKIASIFGVENIDAMMEELETEQAEKDERALANAENELAAAAKFSAVGKAPGAVGGGKPGGAVAAKPSRNSGRAKKR